MGQRTHNLLLVSKLLTVLLDRRASGEQKRLLGVGDRALILRERPSGSLLKLWPGQDFFLQLGACRHQRQGAREGALPQHLGGQPATYLVGAPKHERDSAD